MSKRDRDTLWGGWILRRKEIRVQEKLEVRSLRFTKEGAWINIKLPISMKGFDLMEKGLSDARQYLPVAGGHGPMNGNECEYAFGPFTETKEAEDLIDTLRREVAGVLEADRRFRARFSHLVKEWPLGDE